MTISNIGTMNSGSPDCQHIGSPKIAYMMSRFPKITETFILYEMLAAESAGASVEVFPIRRERTQTMHPEAVAYVKRAHFLPLMSLEILRDNLKLLATRPGLWLRTLMTVVRANLGSRRYLTGALAAFPSCATLARRMKESQIDHVHAHFASHPAAAAWIIHQFSGIPYSFVAHGSDLHRDRHMLCEKVCDAAFVVAISEYNRQIILDETGHDFAAKVKVIHCGVNPEEFQPDGKSERPLSSSKCLHIFCIGTLHEVKGQEYLIQAIQRTIANAHQVVLHLVGDGPDEQKLRAQVKAAGLNDSVIFEGRRNRHEVIRLLQTADILVVPSVPTADGRREGIPVVLMEAMASGVPVIASRLSGIPELVEHNVNGLLSEPRDSAGIADAIELLRHDVALRRRLGAAGQNTVKEHFNMENSVVRLLTEIQRAKGNSRTSAVLNNDRTLKPENALCEVCR